MRVSSAKWDFSWSILLFYLSKTGILEKSHLKSDDVCCKIRILEVECGVGQQPWSTLLISYIYPKLKKDCSLLLCKACITDKATNLYLHVNNHSQHYLQIHFNY